MQVLLIDWCVVEGLAVLLIDGASFIDPDDTEWQVLCSYQLYKGVSEY